MPVQNHHHVLVAVFVSALLVLLLVAQWVASGRSGGGWWRWWETSVAEDPTLLTASVDPRDGAWLQHVERRTRHTCPRRARRQLWEEQRRRPGCRLVMFRDGAFWHVCSGRRMTVRTVAGEGGGTMTVLFPRTPANAEAMAAGAGAAAVSPAALATAGLVAHPRSVLRPPDADGGLTGRFLTLAEAAAALPPDDATTQHFVVGGGTNDPSFYVACRRRSPPAGPPVIQAAPAGVDTTVYARRTPPPTDAPAQPFASAAHISRV